MKHRFFQRTMSGEISFVILPRAQDPDAKKEEYGNAVDVSVTQPLAPHSVRHVRALFDYDPEVGNLKNNNILFVLLS